ncbi:MAG: T9SS type A sorting domain-containing protein [Bacteroidetes bacterium]|nr:T9SS type A sorting domain-containing protein [Bacteroidota bacterium]
MKKLTFTIILILSQILLFAQIDESCLPDGITFETQAEIDSFQINYPNCTEIEGDVEVYGNSIANLNGLNVLTAIGGTLYIHSSNSLTNLVGLESLTSIGGTLDIQGSNSLTNLVGLESLTSIGSHLHFFLNQNLVSLSGLENLTSIGGSLSLFHNSALASLTALENLTLIGGNITIYSNDALTNLSGLENISSLGGGLYIYNNDYLNSLTGLDNLTSVSGGVAIISGFFLNSLIGLDNLTFIGGDLEIFTTSLSSLAELENLTSIEGGITIHGNYSLTSLSGLDNINFESIDFLEIYNNSNLSFCEIESVCGYLANPGGPVTIYNNATGCNSPPEIASNCGIVLSCLPFGNYYFTKQIDIDSFQVNYPNCTNLEGIVEIKGSGLTNLLGLSAVTSIGEDLLIYENNGLNNLAGLNNVTSIGRDLLIYANNDLTSLTGLDNVTSIGRDLLIYANNDLTSLTGLDNVTSIGRDLLIYANNDLTSLTGMESLNSIEKDLIIGVVDMGGGGGNPLLSNLIGLANLTSIGGNLNIVNNDTLSTCEVQSICDYLTAPGGTIEIHDNATGCNSPEEVEEACFFSCLPEGIEFNSQIEIDSFQSNFLDCVRIKGNVTISGEDISNLNGLNVLISIDGNLEITGNNTLTSLSGLNSINSLGGNLWIAGNDALNGFSGLINITSIGGSIHIESNASIINLWGLENIEPGSINELSIFENASLSKCDVQKVCEYIASPGATVQIYNNAAGCNSLEEIEDACEYHCLVEGIIFNTQAEIDGFQYNYPLCSEIDGDIKISGDDISNLNGLDVLTFLGGDLDISGNPFLVSLIGLNNLIYLSGALDIYNNDALLDLTGLDNLDLIGGGLFIDKNDLLSNLTGLENLTFINNGLTIGTFSPGGGNPNLSDLSGLSNLYSIEGGLYIKFNPELTSLTGIDNLSEIDGAIEIKANGSLANIADLSNIDPGSINSLMLTLNPSLSDCTAESICSYLASPNANVMIENNAPGCNNQQEVEDACDSITSVNNESVEPELSISPNPVNDKAVLSMNLQSKSSVEICIYNTTGICLKTWRYCNVQPGQKDFVLNMSKFRAGIYFCRIKVGNETITKKIIKTK